MTAMYTPTYLVGVIAEELLVAMQSLDYPAQDQERVTGWRNTLYPLLGETPMASDMVEDALRTLRSLSMYTLTNTGISQQAITLADKLYKDALDQGVIY